MTGKPSASEIAAMALLEEALERCSGERESYIREREDVPEEVREEALALLGAVASGGARMQTGGIGAASAMDEELPEEIGGYRIIGELGRGGMGTVYLGERASADFDHRVAIKVIKPGVFSESLVERFRRERRILARLNHAHIAHLYDGGETEEGLPFIVMEYVEGRTLGEWLAEENPSLDARLDLFAQVALALEFAHQNLVIHRDLTPANVLVTAEGQAKLIDFGIARPQDPDDASLQPAADPGLSMTPGFAAPERARGVTSNTLSDIYSLGRILALMLPPGWPPELGAIADKASAFDPADRYPSASEMLEEVERFRRDLPVRAVSGSRSYRFRLFAKRQKLLVGATAAVILALALGLVATGWAYQRSEHARAEAEERFSEVRDLANFQLFDLYDELDNVIGNTAARVALTQKAQVYLEELAESRTSDAALQLETARGFLRLALIQGIPAHPNFGEPELADANLDRAEKILTRLSTDGVAEADTQLATTHAYRALLLAHWASKPKESRATIEKAEKALARVPDDKRGWDWMQARRISRVAAVEWADLELDNDMLARYATLLGKEIGEWPEEHRKGYEADFDRALIANVNAIVSHNVGEEASYREAVTLYLDADAKFAAMEAKWPNDPLVLYRRAWNAYYGYAAAATIEDEARSDELLAQARGSVERLLKVEENDQSLVTFAERLREAQAEFFSNHGRHTEAIALQGSVIKGRRAKIGKDRAPRSVSDLAYGQAIFGKIYANAGRKAEACASWAEAEALMAELKKRDALNAYVEELRPGIQANLRVCRTNQPVSAFRALEEA